MNNIMENFLKKEQPSYSERLEAAKLLRPIANEMPEQKTEINKQIFYILSGQILKPIQQENEIYYSATEAGEIFKVHPSKIGRIANEYRLKTAENGKWFYKKGQHSDKLFPTFHYNNRGISQLQKILSGK